MKAFVFDVEFTWGFQARVAGLSKSPPSYIFPPPTTVIGALAESIARRLGRGEMDGAELMREISKSLLSISFKSINAIPSSFMSIYRSYAIGSRGGTSYPTVKDVEVYRSFDAPAKGSTFMGTMDDEPPRVRYFMAFRDNSLVTSEDIWSVKRLGSKESLVAVVKVFEASVTTSGKKGKVCSAFPMAEGIEIKSNAYLTLTEHYVNPYSFSASPAEVFVTKPNEVVPYAVFVPIIIDKEPCCEVEIKTEKYTLYSFRYDEKEEEVVGIAV
jgi:CRISPR-associated protein Cas5a/b/c